ncbi:Response regulator receiver domain-containing protein [Candidatus Electronema halotolerans]|jgi:DNA-binding response OmpR family regulator
MRVIFCEECGGRNNVREELLERIDSQPIICQFCGNVMSKETVIQHRCSVKTINTLHYHLLFIDDDVFHLQLMKKTLEKEFTVSIASTGIHGLDLAAARQPDLILLDLNMPGMDGYEVCRRLKENPKTRRIAVIFVSARDREDDECQGFSLGAVDYISKPINLQILNARIMVQLRIKQLLEQQRLHSDSLIQSLHQNTMATETELDQLRRENSRLLAMLDSVQEKIFVENREGQVSWANRQAVEFFGLSLTALLGRTSKEVLSSGGASCDECLPAANGCQAKFLHLPLFNEDGEAEGCAHILQENPAQLCQAAELAINSFIDRNREAIRENLATILFGIDAVSSILRDNKEFETVSRPVVKAAERLDQMVGTLLDFQRPDRES